jgi:hypothetical protein
MEVYLTFDDGIQAGTEEVLRVLKETGVKATFFLTGIELSYAYKRKPDKCLEILKEIYEHHAIGNHTYSHANDYYTDYYANDGVQIDNLGNRMSILNDYMKGSDEINRHLELIFGSIISKDFPLAKNQKIPLARFPGRNTWYLTKIPGAKTPDSTQQNLVQCEPGTIDKAGKLHAFGYQIFGWHAEWIMNFDFHHDAIRKKDKKRKLAALDYSNEEELHPYFDMCADENLGKDRLTESLKSIEDKIFNKAIEKRTVVLMHDRAFRKGFAHYDGVNNITTNINRTTNSESDKLNSLITRLKKHDVHFKSLDAFFSNLLS